MEETGSLENPIPSAKCNPDLNGATKVYVEPPSDAAEKVTVAHGLQWPAHREPLHLGNAFFNSFAPASAT
jgi:hypothetical protein